MSETLAFLCPGQGAQQVGMGVDLIAEFPIVREVFAEADEVLGFSLSGLCAEGPEEDLLQTENAQPALLAMSVSLARVLGAEGGLRPTIAAGHSLGEWSALVIAGVLSFEDALLSVRKRGLFMREAMPAGAGGMSALLGAEKKQTEALCREATQGEASLVAPANWNGGGQVVVAGHLGALDRLEGLAKDAGVRATRLKVSQPFHSVLMAPARTQLEPVLESLHYRAGSIPVVANVHAESVQDQTEWVQLLAAQMTSPVQWESCALAIVNQATAAIEVGPGRVLSGLMRRIAKGYPCAATGTVDGVRKVLENTKGNQA